MTFDSVIEKIKQERKRQDDKYGIQRHSNVKWLKIFFGELDEFLMVDIFLGNKDIFINYLVQIVAVGVAWLESIEE